MIELLSRHPDILGEPKGLTIEPLPIDEDISSLSAIIMVDVQGQVEIPESLQKSTQKILDLIAENPKVTTQEMADSLGIIRRAVAKHIKKLQEQSIIRRVGPDKGGHWEIIEEP